ncbi:membrane-bound PQQ-dependent dehydrogenase, glucose/quinate/shikimate family [Luteimonas sp. BDR2-5]|uniref:membrane-bound PQQ-dependent dehydrogenase, glucose/quinate/shikimate family n=1 Tax=Proluteimonas luteida TaxID=2878685 RepID=UPI001E36A09A|nr:membrane-bound PQQ-dependent dehydrogenase, glucose/quinate/shikimate family [Luteimonas sp. BDR2-5]MCD9029129.1 membrane-bound PQQ-dependent dehydrogenase, glucose/quinate/shikimate family [Luteimonas sp. BDR2-5]
MNTVSAAPERAGSGHWPLRLFGAALILIGLPLLGGGLYLITLGGSWYYLLAGLALAVSGFFYFRRAPVATWLLAATTVATVLWSLWEVGARFWPLVPRLAPFLVLAFFAALLQPCLRGGRGKGPSWSLAGVLALGTVVGLWSMTRPHGVIRNDATLQPIAGAQVTASPERWQHYGNSPAGTRYVDIAQIDRDNVAGLEVAWTYRTGEFAEGASEQQNTPLQVGELLYTCTPENKVYALDVDTGEERWRYDAKPAETRTWNRCRGLGYYAPGEVAAPYAFAEDAEFRAARADAAATSAAPATCAARIVMTTIDARLIQLDAATGVPCADFGNGGTVDLSVGMGDIEPNVYWYYLTSAPTVVHNLIILGGWTFDGRSTDEPSGVVRAFSADTGALIWAWDLGNPAITKLPPDGETYTRSTPNVWSTPAFDAELGLVYLPTGNQQPDFWGGVRPPLTEKYSSSVVALDIATGRERWTFQTVHHDIWDYDVPAQPALVDLPDGDGGTTPALVQLTKRGQIFLLDRRDGTPLANVEEKPAPQDVAAGDWVAPTQPYSTGMPALGADPLTERDMWGATFFDQLYCRIAFRQLNYHGEFTAPSLTPTLIYPGYYGGFNWGSAAVEERTGTLFLNDIRMPQVVQLQPREDVDVAALTSGHGVGSTYPMDGTPFVIDHRAFNSPLGVPCHAPPWGVFAAIDLQARKLLWERPAGSVRDVKLHGIRPGFPAEVGMPTLGGGVVTAGGLAFYAGTQDYYLRALDIASGDELWKGRLPVGAQATPMSYVSPKTGRQYVVIAAGGARQSPDRGDYVIAYALPATRPAE